MARKSGITPKTLNHLILDAGIVVFNFNSTDPNKPQRILGATRGGSEWKLSGERRDMPVDGIQGIVRGASRFLGTTAELTVNLVEISPEILKSAIPGSTATSQPAVDENGVSVTGENHYLIQRRLESTIPTLDYYDVALIAEVSNTKAPVVLGIKNGISGGEVSFSFQDGDESTLPITFSSTVDPLDPDDEGWFILFPEKIAQV